ncbi:MAG: GlsB/YeaQ/YmgE family stress response membrane protein [Pirellulales bacterium]
MFNLIWFLLIGLAAGWLAGKIMKTGHRGLAENLVVGVIGALVGGFFVSVLDVVMRSLIGQLLSATLGAILLIFLLRKFRRA